MLHLNFYYLDFIFFNFNFKYVRSFFILLTKYFKFTLIWINANLNLHYLIVNSFILFFKD